MNLCYYTSQIKEELNGAIDYIQRAINCKKEHSDWASMYARMSEAELEHATNLQKIFESDFSQTMAQYDGLPDFITDVRININNMVTEYGAKIKYMHQMYSDK